MPQVRFRDSRQGPAFFPTGKRNPVITGRNGRWYTLMQEKELLGGNGIISYQPDDGTVGCYLHGGFIIRSEHYPELFCCLLLLGGAAPAALAIVIPDFSSNVTAGAAPLPVRFWDESTSPLGWAWFFGDETYAQPWTAMNLSSGWGPRYAHTSVVLPDGSIVLMGGYDKSIPDGWMNDTWRSVDDGKTWVQMNASPGWSAREGHSSVALMDGSIVLMGGSYGPGVYLSDTWRSADKGATWTLVNASSGWSARGGHGSVVLPDGSIVLTGGNIKNDTWRSTDNGKTWTRVNASSGWTRRNRHSSVAMPDGSIVLMGGWDGSNYRNDSWRSTDMGAHWILMNESPGWTARSDHTSVTLPDGSFGLIGGGDEDSGYRSDSWRSTDNGASWTLINASCGWPLRQYHSSVVLPNGSIVLTGGYYSGFSRSDTWRFQPVGSSLQHPSHLYTSPGTYTVALQAFNPDEYNSTLKAGFITVAGHTKAGIFRSGLWGLDYNGNFGWDGSDKSFTIGQAGDIPVTGDWNRDGKDEIGIFRSGTWALDFNGNDAWDAGDKAFIIGQAGDVPVVGDWNGNGNDSVGIYRNGLWGLDYNDNYAWDGADKAFYLGTTGDMPVVGDWDASGSDSAGIFRNGLWGVDYNGNFAWDGADKAFNLGTIGDKPVVGDWDASGSDSAGIFRNGLWGVDYNGNFAWDASDKAFNLGTTGDVPVLGRWS